MSDEEIVQLMVDGKEEGLNALLLKHGGKIRAFIVKRFGSAFTPDEVDELMYTTAYTAWTKSKSFDSRRGSLGAWLIVITSREAIDLIRYKKRHRMVSIDDHEPDRRATSGRPVDDLFLRHHINECIERLSERLRAIAKADLDAGGRESTETLTLRLDIPAGTLFVTRSTARKMLRRCLELRGYE